MDSHSTNNALALEDSNDQEQAPRQRPKRAMLENLSVRASLWLAFASVLAGAVAIGVFSLFQMGRLNASTKAIYEQEYAAGQAAEQARGLILRASRARNAARCSIISIYTSQWHASSGAQ